MSVSSFMQDVDSSNKLKTPLIKEEPVTAGMYITKAGQMRYIENLCSMVLISDNLKGTTA